jgi:hypothetical protein
MYEYLRIYEQDLNLFTLYMNYSDGTSSNEGTDATSVYKLSLIPVF